MFVISNLQEVVTPSSGDSNSNNNTSIMSSTSFNNINNNPKTPTTTKSSSNNNNNNNKEHNHHQQHQYHQNGEETQQRPVVGLFNTGILWSDSIETSSTTTETTSVSTSTVAASVLNYSMNAVSDYLIGSGGGENAGNEASHTSTSSRNNNNNNNNNSRPSLGLLSSMFSSSSSQRSNNINNNRSFRSSSKRNEYYLGRMMGVSEGNLLYHNSNNNNNNNNSNSPPSTKRSITTTKGSSMNNMTELVPMSFTLDGDDGLSTTFEYFDPTEGDVIGNALMAYTMNNQWQKVKQNLERLCNTGSCSEERLYYVKIISTTIAKSWPINVNRDNRLSPMLDKWKETEPGNVDCLIIRAESYLEWSWHVRPVNFGLFISRLRLCAYELQEAQLFRPDDPLIYAIGINLAKALGREWGDDNIMTVEECLSALSHGGIAAGFPTTNTNTSGSSDDFESYLYTAHIDALYNYCETSSTTASSRKHHMDGDGGDDGISHQQQAILAYARNVTSNLPIGHPLWMVIPLAHYECQKLHQQMSINKNVIDDNNNQNRKKKAPPNSISTSSSSSSSSSLSSQQYNYWKQRDVIEEITMAYNNAFPLSGCSGNSGSGGSSFFTEETSIMTTAASRKRRPYAKKIEWACRNYFAYALTKCCQKDLARQQIRIIGRRPIDGHPWGNINGYKSILREDLKFEF